MKSIVVQGQLSLFDEPDNVISAYPTKEEKNDNIIYSELIDKYKDKCTRIAMVEKKLYIEINNETLSFEVGDRVKFNYNGQQVGKITRIYNAGETFNVSWNNKATAFYYKNVEKINV